jgi:5-methylthioadenosine/S-adenosylhomocysteine deaminase
MSENYVFTNATIITMDKVCPVQYHSCLVTEQGRISYIGKELPLQLPASHRKIDASHLLLCPGLVNAHTHTPMTLLRGYSDDCPLEEWLSHIWPAENALSEEDYYYGSLLGIAEMLSYGTTSISDMYRSSHTILRAAIESGIKANICESITSAGTQDPALLPSVIRSAELIKEYNGWDEGRIRCDTSIQSVFQTTPALWEYIGDLAFREHIGIHMHICETEEEIQNCIKEYGSTPIACLEKAGVFRARVVAAHGIYVSPEELEILAASQATVVHDPCSNLKCCCGFANLKPFLLQGIPVALGTDGVCSNNSGDLFETMKFTALNQKMLNRDPGFADAAQVLSMATLGGLISQGRQEEAGILAPGKDADIIALDLTHPGLCPLTSPISNLVYAAHGNHVVMTMVRGKLLYEKGEYLTIDMEKVRYEVKRRVNQV